MPQMSPIYWLILMMYFIFMLSMLIMMIFFFYGLTSSLNLNMLKTNNFNNWMW